MRIEWKMKFLLLLFGLAASTFSTTFAEISPMCEKSMVKDTSNLKTSVEKCEKIYRSSPKAKITAEENICIQLCIMKTKGIIDEKSKEFLVPKYQTYMKFYPKIVQDVLELEIPKCALDYAVIPAAQELDKEQCGRNAKFIDCIGNVLIGGCQDPRPCWSIDGRAEKGKDQLYNYIGKTLPLDNATDATTTTTTTTTEEPNVLTTSTEPSDDDERHSRRLKASKPRITADGGIEVDFDMETSTPETTASTSTSTSTITTTSTTSTTAPPEPATEPPTTPEPAALSDTQVDPKNSQLGNEPDSQNDAGGPKTNDLPTSTEDPNPNSDKRGMSDEEEDGAKPGKKPATTTTTEDPNKDKRGMSAEEEDADAKVPAKTTTEDPNKDKRGLSAEDSAEPVDQSFSNKVIQEWTTEEPPKRPDAGTGIQDRGLLPEWRRKWFKEAKNRKEPPAPPKFQGDSNFLDPHGPEIWPHFPHAGFYWPKHKGRKKRKKKKKSRHKHGKRKYYGGANWVHPRSFYHQKLLAQVKNPENAKDFEVSFQEV